MRLIIPHHSVEMDKPSSPFCQNAHYSIASLSTFFVINAIIRSTSEDIHAYKRPTWNEPTVDTPHKQTQSNKGEGSADSRGIGKLKW